MYHEFSRPDRENHINLLWQNMTQEGIDTYNVIGQLNDFSFGSFDIKSIMMYNKFALAKKQPDGSYKPVWTPKENVFHSDNVNVSKGDAGTVKAMYANVYIVQGETLYAANAKDGAYVNYSGYWKGAAKTIAINGHDMYAMQNGNLYRIERLTGKYKKIGNGNWTGAVGVTGMDPQGYMYAQAGTRLWKIDATGNFTRLGGAAALEDWTGCEHVNNVYNREHYRSNAYQISRFLAGS
nr:M12 family metallopeptidase [Dyadobacter fanqingshengii]